MIEAGPIFFMAAVVVISALLVVLGVQLFYVLRDARRLINQCNEVVADFRKIGFNLGSGYNEMLGFFSGIKKVFFIIDLLAKKKKSRKSGGMN